LIFTTRFLPDVLFALFKAREARGNVAMATLRSRVHDAFHDRNRKTTAISAANTEDQIPYFTIRLSRTDAQTFEPLGWKLSHVAEKAIQRAWPDINDKGRSICNANNVARLRAWLIKKR
jgi:hypothetical protein